MEEPLASARGAIRVPLEVTYLDASRVEDWVKSAPGDPIARVSYGGYRPFELTDRGIEIHLDLPQLQDPPWTEVWMSPLPVTYVQEDGMGLAINSQMLFGYLHADETPASPLESAAYQGYRRLLGRARSLGYPHWVRLWNCFPGINRESSALERYQQFCVGRHQAFAEGQPDYRRSLPAATAMGTASGPLQIYFLASRWPVSYIENPRQISAYDYPPIYGPRSPSFARATLQSTEGERRLFIAGTASIVGHASQHPGDPRKQTLETIANLEQVIQAARSSHCDPRHALRRGGLVLLKIYIRHPEHLATIQSVLAEHLGFEPCSLYLQGEMCRSALLVEIEGIVTI